MKAFSCFWTSLVVTWIAVVNCLISYYIIMLFLNSFACSCAHHQNHGSWLLTWLTLWPKKSDLVWFIKNLYFSGIYHYILWHSIGVRQRWPGQNGTQLINATSSYTLYNLHGTSWRYLYREGYSTFRGVQCSLPSADQTLTGNLY